jgi:hypothetical protein
LVDQVLLTQADTTEPDRDNQLEYAVDDRTTYSSDIQNGLSISQVRVCLDDACNQNSVNQDTFLSTGDRSIRFSQTVASCDRIDSADEWVQAVEEAYATYLVPEAIQVAVPMAGDCLTSACPTEADWCETDPECSESPYKEPDASVESGVIAGFTVAGIVLLIGMLYYCHVMRVKQQERRYKTKFAKRIADTISLRVSMRQLTPEALASEFKKIDSETQDGQITKEELWTFLESGKAGELSESDFNALFSAIDLDGNGTVDFLEYCTFMGKCSGEYRSARADRGSVADRASRRISVADVTARRLSTATPDASSGDAAKVAAEAIAEEEDVEEGGGEK